jgi:phosphatidylglycerol---prolipoprotein diacylglyceryl transferase
VAAFYLPGGIPVYGFSILLGLGIGIGLAWVTWVSPRKQARHHLTAALWVLLGGLLGGRVVFVALNWPYFQSHAGETALVFLGGLAWPGALAGGWLALVIYAWASHLPLGHLADAMLPLVTALAVSAWLGCWLDGCAYGPAATAWWALPSRDEWGAVARRIPTQLLGALLTLVIVGLLDWSRKRLYRTGQAAALALLGLSIVLFGLSFLRADPAPQWNGLRLEAWAAIGYIGIAILTFITISFWPNSRRERN